MNGLKVKDSKIEGKGLFADKEFNEGDLIGIAHINGKPTGMIGRFHNHSDKPNAHSISIGNKKYLAALRPLMKGEEITVDYRRQPDLEQPEQFQKGGEPGDKFKKRLMKRYPGMQGVYGPEGENLNIVKDPNYDAASEPYNAGNIEFMFPGLPQVSYPNKKDETLPDYVYVNPSPDKYTSVYNPRGANRADIFLDMMHGMRDDQNYEVLLQNFDKAVRDARGGDMQYYYEQDVANNNYTDGQEQWDDNYVDGQLRAQLAPGTLGMFSHGRRDYKKERRHDSPEMKAAAKDIRNYLKGDVSDTKNPALIEEYAKGGDPGKGKKDKKQSKNVQPFITSDPAEYAKRKAAYDDSLRYYKAYQMQDKLMGPGSKIQKKSNLTWSTKDLKSGRQKKIVKGLERYGPIADDYQSESHQFKKGYNDFTARKSDQQLIKYYKSLGFTDKDIMYHSSPDIVSDKIKAVGTYFDGYASSPVYRKPSQEVIFESKEQQYPTSYEPVVNNTQQKPPEGKIIVGQQEVQQLDPKTGKVSTVITPIYGDRESKGPTHIPTYVNPELQKFVEERKPEPPGTGTDVMPVYDTDELPMYATPDRDAQWIGDTERYVDWDGNRIPYRLPRFRKPGHGGDLIRRGKQRYIPFPSIESRYQAEIVPEEEYQDGGEPKRKKYRFIKDTEEAKEFPVDEWGQYIQEEPEVVVRPLTPEQQQARNMEWGRMEMARRNPHLYLPDGTLRPQAAQSADWVWQLGAMGPAGLEGLGALAAKQIPRTGLTIGTVLNAAAGIHGATQVPQRIQDWQDVAAGEKDWKEAAAESLMTGLELYGGYDAAKTLLPQTYKINPWALKENPEMYLYRTQPKDFVAGLTEEEHLKNLITDKIIKGEEVPWHLKGKLHKMQIAPEPFREALNKYHGQWFDKNPARMEWYMKSRLDDEVGDILRLKVPKSEGDAFNLKNFPEAQKASLNYESEFIVPRERLGQAEKFSTEDLKRLMQEDATFNKPHWLKGYKGVPKQLPGSPNNFSIFPKDPTPIEGIDISKGRASKTINPEPLFNPKTGLKQRGNTTYLGPVWGPKYRGNKYNNSKYADPALLDEGMQPYLLGEDQLRLRYPWMYK
jgi:hypothetical protein